MHCDWQDQFDFRDGNNLVVCPERIGFRTRLVPPLLFALSQMKMLV